MSISAAEQGRWQFAMRDLLAWTWCAGAIASAGRSGLSTLAVFGVPLSIVGYRAIARSQNGHWPGWRVVARRYWSVFVCGLLLAALLLRGVWPLDAASGMALAGGVLWSISLAGDRRRLWRMLAPAPIAGFIYLLVCSLEPQLAERFIRGVPRSVLLQDVRGGRNGVQLLDDFSYSWPGPNSALIERYLGLLDAEWEGRWYVSKWYAGLDERVNRRSIIRQPDLPDVLAMLPSDDARRQVLTCVTTTKNQARVHQGLLLVALKRFGYPQGYDADRWWRKHEPVFRVVEDPLEASRMVCGWRNAIRRFMSESETGSPSPPNYAVQQQLDAALMQEMGMWGGDGDFSDAYYLMAVRRKQAGAAKGDATPGPNQNVAWWNLTRLQRRP